MTFSHRHRLRWIRRLALGFAVAAIVAPVAQGMPLVSAGPYARAHRDAGLVRLDSATRGVQAISQAPRQMCALSGECRTLSVEQPGATEQGPTLAQLRQFSFVPDPTPIERPAPGLTGGVGTPTCAPGCYFSPAYGDTHPGPVTTPAYSTDGPRTAPDALVKPVPVAEPGTDWRTIGASIAGGLAALMLAASAIVARRRHGTLAGL